MYGDEVRVESGIAGWWLRGTCPNVRAVRSIHSRPPGALPFENRVLVSLAVPDAY